MSLRVPVTKDPWSHEILVDPSKHFRGEGHGTGTSLTKSSYLSPDPWLSYRPGHVHELLVGSFCP